jgi:hypothetical protein
MKHKILLCYEINISDNFSRYHKRIEEKIKNAKEM